MAVLTCLSLSLVSSLFAPMCILIITLLILHRKRNSHKNNGLPPGEMGLPWIGETIHFYKCQRKNRLYEEFVQPRIAKHGKIFKTRLMGSPTVVVNGAEANRFFMSNEFKLVISSWPSSSVQLMGKNSIMERQGEAHRLLRRVIASSLGPAALEAIVPKMCTSIQMHLENNWHGTDTIRLYQNTKKLTFTIVFECFLGIRVEPNMLGIFERVLEGVFAPAISFPGSKFRRAKSARREIEKILVEVVRRKRDEMEGMPEKSREEDETLLSRLVSGLIKGEITEEEVVDNVVLLVFAAHDTTSFAIAMTFRMLAQHPDCYSILLQGTSLSLSLLFKCNIVRCSSSSSSNWKDRAE